MTIADSESRSRHSDVMPALPRQAGELQIVEPKRKNIFDAFSEVPKHAALADNVERNAGFSPSFNASLLDFITIVAPYFRGKGVYKGASPESSLALLARNQLSAYKQEVEHLPPAGRKAFREEQLAHYGKLALDHASVYPEIAIAGQVAAGYSRAGRAEVVQAIGESMIAFGRSIEMRHLAQVEIPETPTS